jgi:hypothetical protein
MKSEAVALFRNNNEKPCWQPIQKEGKDWTSPQNGWALHVQKARKETSLPKAIGIHFQLHHGSSMANLTALHCGHAMRR